MTTDQEWEEFKAKYKKSYKDAKEEQMRRKLFLKSKKRVDEHNKRYEAQKEDFRIYVSSYSDYTPKECAEIYRSGNGCPGYFSWPGVRHCDEIEGRMELPFVADF